MQPENISNIPNGIDLNSSRVYRLWIWAYLLMRWRLALSGDSRSGRNP